MGKFGWVHITGANKVAKGPDGAIQFASGSDGDISGSSNLTYDHNSDFLVLSGNMNISGTLRANVFDVITTTKTEIDISGSTSFGDDSGDQHVFTGSLSIFSGGISITIPSASVAGPGRILIIKDETASTRSDSTPIAVSASTGETIDNQSAYTLSGDNPALTIYSNGISKWFIY